MKSLLSRSLNRSCLVPVVSSQAVTKPRRAREARFLSMMSIAFIALGLSADASVNPVAGSSAKLVAPHLSLATLADSHRWTVTHPAPDRVFLNRRDSKQAILIVEYRSDISVADADHYLEHDYIREAKSAWDQGLEFKQLPFKRLAFASKKYRDKRFGEIKFDLDVSEGIATFTERVWPEHGRLWQVTIVDYGAFTTSPTAQDEELDRVMTLITDSKTAQAEKRLWFNFVMPDAGAAETGSAKGDVSLTERALTPIQTNSKTCESLRIDPKNRADGSPAIRVGNDFSITKCGQDFASEIPKMLDSTKKAFVSGLEDLEARTDISLAKHPCEKPTHPTGFSGWVTYVSNVQLYDQCLQDAGTTAVIQKAGDMVTQTSHAVGSLALWVWTEKNPEKVLAVILADKIKEFGCLNAETQKTMFCEFVAKACVAAGTTVVTAGVGSAGAAALSGAKGVVVLETGLAAARAAMLAPIVAPVKIAKDFAESASVAGDASKAAVKKVFVKTEVKSEAAGQGRVAPDAKATTDFVYLKKRYDSILDASFAGARSHSDEEKTKIYVEIAAAEKRGVSERAIKKALLNDKFICRVSR